MVRNVSVRDAIRDVADIIKLRRKQKRVEVYKTIFAFCGDCSCIHGRRSHDGPDTAGNYAKNRG